MTSSCDDWNELNVNPNQPTEVPTTNVFGSGLMVATRTLFGERVGLYYAGTWAGQTAAIGLGDYEFRVDINNGQWDELYRAMAYFVDAQKRAEEQGNSNLHDFQLQGNANYSHVREYQRDGKHLLIRISGI